MLLILNNVGQSFGQFDGYDGLSSTLLGGEVATLVNYGVTGTDKAAKDIFDGYVVTGPAPTLQNRPIVTTGGSVMTGSEGGFVFLTDDGTTGYGTLFGSVVGGTAGQVVSGGTVLGPNTMTGSGKITLWHNPGLYGVTLDALNASFTPSANLTVGTNLYYDAAGKLCLLAQRVGSCPVVANLVEFTAGDTLVTTPRSLTRVGIVGGTIQFKYAVINWNPRSV